MKCGGKLEENLKNKKFWKISLLKFLKNLENKFIYIFCFPNIILLTNQKNMPHSIKENIYLDL